jgi:hypothetical protein
MAGKSLSHGWNIQQFPGSFFLGLGALLGWMTSRKQQIASTVAAVAVAVPAAANAMVDYDAWWGAGGAFNTALVGGFGG